jgi:hypothetical protein
MRYKGYRVVSISRGGKPGELINVKAYGYVVLDPLIRAQKVVWVDRDTYAMIATHLLFERFCDKKRGWLHSCGLDFDALTVQLAVEIERAGLAPTREFEHHDGKSFGVRL